jgi:hypothetical protein
MDDLSRLQRESKKLFSESRSPQVDSLDPPSKDQFPEREFSNQAIYLLTSFQQAKYLQSQLSFYEMFFSQSFPLQILLTQMSQKYQSYISLFRDIITVTFSGQLPFHPFGFTVRQLSYIYFYWKSDYSAFRTSFLYSLFQDIPSNQNSYFTFGDFIKDLLNKNMFTNPPLSHFRPLYQVYQPYFDYLSSITLDFTFFSFLLGKCFTCRRTK